MITAKEAKSFTDKSFLLVIEAKIKEAIEKGEYNTTIDLNNTSDTLYDFIYKELVSLGYLLMYEYISDKTTKLLHIAWHYQL